MFEGKRDWHDRWDFDSKVSEKVLGGNVGRPGTAQIAVAAVAALVDGVRFDVDSESIHVVQHSGCFPVY